MMLKYVSADWVFPVSSAPIKNGVIEVAADGKIINLFSLNEAQERGLKDIVHYHGVLVPGFVNTHCHLELSHLLGKVSEKTGLTNFIKELLGSRNQAEAAVIKAMEAADKQMYENGIVAVGDISNLLVSRSIKLESKIYYHTFVEVFGFNRLSAPIITAGVQLKKDFMPLRASVVPHAPYSVSAELFAGLCGVTATDDLVSIHNQETASENELFENGTGKFSDFFAELGIAQSETHGLGKNSLNYHLPKLPKNVNTLLVHNTFTNKADIDFAVKEQENLYWCLCPNANLYIEGTLPDVTLLKEENLTITLGTDSLASNHQLSILAEMQVLQQQKQVSFEELLKWATLNGAKFLGIDAQYGSIEIGKKPGIILVDIAEDNMITEKTTIKRLF